MASEHSLNKILNTSCLHQSAHVPASQTVPDYQSLSHDEMRRIILLAFSSNSGRTIAKVQCRLVQAVEGQVCPHEIDGPVAKKTNALEEAFVDSRRKGDAAGAIAKVGKILGLQAPKG